MREHCQTIILRGKEYKLIFTTQALFETQEKFGGFTKMTTAMAKDKREALEVIAWLVTTEANQAIEADRYFEGKDEPNVSEEDILKALLFATPAIFLDIKTKAMDALNEGLTGKIIKEEVESESEDEVLAEIKNAEGAAKKNQ